MKILENKNDSVCGPGNTILDGECFKKNFNTKHIQLKDHYIGEGGSVICPDGSFHPQCNFNFFFWKTMGILRSLNLRELQKYTPKELEETSLPPIDIKKFNTITLPDFTYLHALPYNNTYEWGHFWDFTQQFRLLDNPQKSDIKILVPEFSEVQEIDLHYKNLNVGHLDKFKIKIPNLGHGSTSLSNKNLIKVPNLIYLPFCAPLSGISVNSGKFIKEKYIKREPTKKHNTKLYLSIANSKRGVLNEQSLIPELKKEGFDILYGNEPLNLIIEKFNNAELIISGHSSILKNIAFCKENTKVIEFCPKNRLDVNFRNIGLTLGLKYKHIPVDANDNFSIRINKLDITSNT